MKTELEIKEEKKLKRAAKQRENELKTVYESWLSVEERAAVIASMNTLEMAALIAKVVDQQNSISEKLDKVLKSIEDLPFEKPNQDRYGRY